MAGVVAVLAVVNSLMPAISRTSSSIVASAESADGRIATQIEIVHATGEAGSSTVLAWSKNVGALSVAPLSRVDVFFGPEDNFVLLTQGTSSCTAPCWYYTMENDTEWSPTATLRITIKWDTNLTSGSTYYIKVVAPNGISDSRFFTV